jgi:tol-pal system protein YbgF
MRSARLAALVLAIGPLCGCVKKDIERLENQVQLLDKRVELLQQDQKKANLDILEGWKRLRTQVEQDLGTAQRSSADSTTRMDDVVREMRQLADRIERTGQQYQRLSEQLAAVQDRLGRGPLAADALGGAAGVPGPDAGGAAGGNQGAATAGPTPPATSDSGSNAGAPAAEGQPSTFEPGVDPELTYKAAYSDYAQGNFKLAIVNFDTYVRQFPTSAKAVLAQYFIGESYYALGQYRDAVAAFDKVITGWPGDEKVPVAYLKKGYALLSMGQKALGIGVLQELISKHPNTHEALLAKERLSAL